MKVNKILAVTIVAFLISLSSFLSILFLGSPEEGFIFILLFYISLFVVLFSFLLFWIFLFNKLFHQTRNLFIYIRRGFLLVFVIVLILIFQNLGILRWWSISILFIIILILEFFFSKER